MDNQKELEALQLRVERLETELAGLKRRFAPDVAREQPSPVREQPRARPEPEPKPKKKRDIEGIEFSIGGNLLGKLGVLAMVLASAWFIRMAFDRQWINESGRILLGIMFGYGVAWAGLRLARLRYRILPGAVFGGGVAVLYLAVFGAFHYYGLLGHTETFVFLVLLSAGAALLAVPADSQVLYVFSLLGAFLAPVLMSQGENSYRFLFSYTALVNIGFLAVSLHRAFRVSSWILLVSDALVFLVWADLRLDESGFVWPFAFVTFVYLVFLARATVVAPRRHALRLADYALVPAATLSYLTTGYLTVQEFHPHLLPHFYLFAAVLPLAALRLHESRGMTGPSFQGRPHLMQGLLLACWAPVALSAFAAFWDEPYAAYGFVGFAGGLSVLGVRLRTAPIFFASLPFWFVALNLTFVYEPEHRLGILNFRFLIHILSASALLWTWYLQRKRPWHRGLKAFIFAAAFTLILGSLRETHDLIDERHYRNLGYSLVLVAYAGAFLAFGILRSLRMPRLGGIALVLLVILKFYLYDIWTLSEIVRIVAGFSLGLGFLVFSIFYQKYRDRIFNMTFKILCLFALSGLSASLYAETFRAAGFRHYKPLTPGEGVASPVYGRFLLDEDILARSGPEELRVAHGGRLLPHFLRPVPLGEGKSGVNEVEVMFSEKTRDGSVYVLSLPPLPEGAEYVELSVASPKDFEAGVSLQLAKKPPAWRNSGHRSIYKYGRTANAVKFRGGDARFVRLRFDSNLDFRFKGATYAPIRTFEDYSLSVPVEDLARSYDSDLEATVIRYENSSRHRIHRLVLSFREKRYRRRMEIRRFDRDSKSYVEFMGAGLYATDESSARQTVDFPSRLSDGFKVTIFDGSDEPLELTAFELHAPKEEVVFELPPEGTDGIRLYYGNPYASPPDYDIRDVYNEDLSHLEFSPGAHRENEEFAYSLLEPPLSSWVIRGLFVLGFALMCLPAWRIFRRYGLETGGQA